MTLKYFKNINAGEVAIKSHYKKLALQFHPDRSTGDSKIMAEINAEYQYIKENAYKVPIEITMRTATFYPNENQQLNIVPVDFKGKKYTNVVELAFDMLLSEISPTGFKIKRKMEK